MIDNKKVCIIAAMNQNMVIGSENEIPWHLKHDLQYFKKITSGSPVVMGRKTFESIGKPLPNRKNIIITSDKEYSAPEGCDVNVIALGPRLFFYSKIRDLVLNQNLDFERIFIIGGGEIYNQCIKEDEKYPDFIDEMYLTIVHDKTHHKNAVHFPNISGVNKWHIEVDHVHEPDADNDFYSTYLVLRKNLDLKTYINSMVSK